MRALLQVPGNRPRGEGGPERQSHQPRTGESRSLPQLETVADVTAPATPEPSHLPPFLTLAQAAEVLQIHKKTAYDWALKRRLPGAFRLPAGTWRVSRDGLLRYVRENRVTSPGESER